VYLSKGIAVRLIAAALLFAATAAQSMAATVLAVDVPDSGPVATPGDFVTVQNLTRGPGLSAPAAPDLDGFGAVGFTGVDRAAAIADGDYFSVSFVTDTDYIYDLTRLRFGVQAGPTGLFTGSGPDTGFVRASADGGGFFDVGPSTFAIGTTASTVDVLLSGIAALQGVSQVEFRIYGFGGTPGFLFAPDGNDGGIVRNQVAAGSDVGLLLEGDPSVVPLPAGLPLLIAGLAALALLRRRAA
jgi:hypothetical protein